MRLIDHILSLGLSRADAKRALQNGKVFVRGMPSALAVREVDPQDVELRAKARRCKPGADLVVMHRASGYVVVWKPSGLLSVPAPGRRDEASVLTQVEGLFGSGLAVHRLDEDTSGLMLVALKEDAQLHLKETGTADALNFAQPRPRLGRTAWTLQPEYLLQHGPLRQAVGASHRPLWAEDDHSALQPGASIVKKEGKLCVHPM